MKNSYLFPLIIALAGMLAFTSCSKEKIDDISNGISFVRFSVNGASLNGSFEIEHNPQVDTTELKATALTVPPSQGEPGVMIITYQDQAKGLSVVLQLPPEKGVVVPPLGWQPPNGVENPYDMGIIHMNSEVILEADNVSVDITKYETNTVLGVPLGLPYTEGTFDGVMFYENEDQQKEFHTVSGSFKYSVL